MYFSCNASGVRPNAHTCPGMAASLCRYTTTGSFSRSAINDSCGAKTQLSGFITGILVLLVLLFLTPVFRLMPYNVMAAIIIVGALQLVEVDTAIELFKASAVAAQPILSVFKRGAQA